MHLKTTDPQTLKSFFDELDTAFSDAGVDFYLIGAIAKEYWFDQGGKTSAGTKDIDFAVLIARDEDYENIRDHLKRKGYAEIKNNAYVLISPAGLQVDILPFGKIEIDETVQLADGGWTSIRVNGFKEVYNAGTETAELSTGHRFKAATLPSVVLLKLIAYDDRPEVRAKDAKDVASIIQHFFQLQSDFIYAHHQNVFVGELETDIVQIGAIVIGRELNRLCADNEFLKKRIQSILEREITAGENSRFVRFMVDETKRDAEEMKGWLTCLLNGYTSTS